MSTTEIQKLRAALESALQILEDEAETRLHAFSKGQWETDAEAIASMDPTDRLYCLPVLSAIEKARAALGLAPYQAPVATAHEIHNQLACQFVEQVLALTTNESECLVVLESITTAALMYHCPEPKQAVEFLDVLTARAIERLHDDAQGRAP